MNVLNVITPQDIEDRNIFVKLYHSVFMQLKQSQSIKRMSNLTVAEFRETFNIFSSDYNNDYLFLEHFEELEELVTGDTLEITLDGVIKEFSVRLGEEFINKLKGSLLKISIYTPYNGEKIIIDRNNTDSFTMRYSSNMKSKEKQIWRNYYW